MFKELFLNSLKKIKNKILGVILAAGAGSRMRSSLPKVLHKVDGEPMLQRVLKAVGSSGCSNVCVVLSKDVKPFEGLIKENKDLAVCLQNEVNGTAGAVGSVAPLLRGVSGPKYSAGASLFCGQPIKADYLLICTGDAAALNFLVLEEFLTSCQSNADDMTVLGMEAEDPSGYGRLLVNSNKKLIKIVEEKEADKATKTIKLCNSGVLFVKTELLFSLLHDVKSENEKKEYYLTDCISLATERGIDVGVVVAQDAKALVGVNDQKQLQVLINQLNSR